MRSTQLNTAPTIHFFLKTSTIYSGVLFFVDVVVAYLLFGFAILCFLFYCIIMTAGDSASSITVAVRVRPFTIREAAQLIKTDDGPVFLGDGSLAAAPPKLSQKGIRPIIKVVDDKCLFVYLLSTMYISI
jgi:hypothetical protein